MYRLLSAMRTGTANLRPAGDLEGIGYTWSGVGRVTFTDCTSQRYPLSSLPCRTQGVLSRICCCITCASLFQPSSRQPPRFIPLPFAILDVVLFTQRIERWRRSYRARRGIQSEYSSQRGFTAFLHGSSGVLSRRVSREISKRSSI